jgi:hypothetical protein
LAVTGADGPLDSSAADVFADRGPLSPEDEDVDDGPVEPEPRAGAESLDEPFDPSEPELSAYATPGIASKPAPTPSATASAPTRPTDHADPDPTFSKDLRCSTSIRRREVAR